MKNSLVLSALVGVLALPVVLVAQMFGTPVPAWLSLEHLLFAFAGVGVALLFAHDYTPRNTARSTAPTAATEPPPFVRHRRSPSSTRSALAFDRHIAILAQNDVTVMPL